MSQKSGRYVRIFLFQQLQAFVLWCYADQAVGQAKNQTQQADKPDEPRKSPKSPKKNHKFPCIKLNICTAY